MKFKPLHDRVLVRRLDADEKSKGGILIPSSAQKRPWQGTVTAVGPDVDPLLVKVGDEVAFGQYSGVEIKLGGEDFTILKLDECFGVFEQEGAQS